MAKRGVTAREVVDARKVKMGKPEIAKLLRGSNRIIAAKGAKVADYDLKKERPVEKDLYALLLGPTGNLRAPTARLGKTLVVGFSDDVWKKVVG